MRVVKKFDVSNMYGAPYIFYFVHPIVKTVEMMIQRVNFEQNLKNIRPATVVYFLLCQVGWFDEPSTGGSWDW